MGQMEHLLNVYVAKAAAGSVAEFMGYIEVSEEEASSRLTPGLWLVRGAAGQDACSCVVCQAKVQDNVPESSPVPPSPQPSRIVYFNGATWVADVCERVCPITAGFVDVRHHHRMLGRGNASAGGSPVPPHQ